MKVGVTGSSNLGGSTKFIIFTMFLCDVVCDDQIDDLMAYNCDTSFEKGTEHHLKCKLTVKSRTLRREVTGTVAFSE